MTIKRGTMAAKISGSIKPRGVAKKRGRPKGSKNKPKPLEAIEASHPTPSEESTVSDTQPSLPAFENAGNESESSAGKMSFDEWMAKFKVYVETWPDDYQFDLDRRYPKFKENGEVNTGVVRTLTEPFNEAWMREAFPEGGRFDILLKGPTGRPEDRYAGLRVVKARFCSLTIPKRGIEFERELPPPSVASRADQYDDEEDEEIAPSNGSGGSMPDSIMQRIVERHLDEGDEAKRKLAEMHDSPPLPLPPPPTMESARSYKESSHDGMLRAMELLSNTLVRKGDGSGASKAELNKLHDLLSDAIATASKKEIEILAKHKEELDKVREAHQIALESQRKIFEKQAEQTTTAHNEQMSALRLARESDISQLREDNREKLSDMRERLADAKSDLQQYKAESVAELNRVREESTSTKRGLEEKLEKVKDDLANSRNDVSELRSKLATLEVTSKSEMQVAVNQAKMDAEKEHRKSNPDDNLDPLSRLLKSVTQAKELTETLGSQLNPTADAAGEPKKSTIEVLGSTIKDLAMSPEVRTTVTSVAKTVGGALGDVAKARQSQQPSTFSLAAAATQPTPNPEPVPEQIETQQTVPSSSPAVIDQPATEENGAVEVDTVEAQIAKAKAQAEEMLDAVETNCSLGTPIPEAAEELVSSLMNNFGVDKGAIKEQLKGATAEETLKELDLPQTRLSDDARKYLNDMIQHVASSD
jgi:hypothetical protein